MILFMRFYLNSLSDNRSKKKSHRDRGDIESNGDHKHVPRFAAIRNQGQDHGDSARVPERYGMKGASK